MEIERYTRLMKEAVNPMKNSKHVYKEGSYRFWLNTETGTLQMKFDGNQELYNVPRKSKLYARLLNDFFGALDDQRLKKTNTEQKGLAEPDEL
ncbi:hypothetical protein AB1L05_15850 [Cytobacillus horneckiae]|uniref:hypothetical protein n=1 Tax=Cytobacillus horneckiae TaxID=549687 RepID=UPI000AE5831C|nr:hypothetical protein [Cytobacillus horneckiae]MEC1155727.1 hypothetical protein [Cytobacillus horneckiae]MED2939266.1 hypothetical protein [Cytobacillus horneckiae]